MTAFASHDSTDFATKLQDYLLASSAERKDSKAVEEILAEGLGSSAYSVNDPLAQRWIVYLSSAVTLRYCRLGWMANSSSQFSSQRQFGRNVADQSELAIISFCDTYNHLGPISDLSVWADGFVSVMQSNVAGNIANQLFLFREAGFESALLDVLCCELLFALDLWLAKIPESAISEEIVALLSNLCSELIRYPKSAAFFMKSSQLVDNEEEIPDNLKPSGGLDFVFTSAYQLFPLFPMPITKLFSACASVSNESAGAVRNVFSNMACFCVQLPPNFTVTNFMHLSHANDCATVTVSHPFKPPGSIHVTLPPGTKGMVLSHWPENGAVQRVLFTYKYNAFEWFAAVSSSVATDSLQLDDGTVLDLLAEVGNLFCGLAKSLDVSEWYDTCFMILGPFSRLAPCLNAIRESTQLVPKLVAILSSVLNFFAALALRCPEDVAAIMEDYWAPILNGGLYGELLSTYECRFADFQITSALCSLMSSFLETKYYEWMHGETLRKNLVALLDSFLHTVLANVATWRFNHLKKRVDHLRRIYALTALIFDVHTYAVNKFSCQGSFSNLFIVDPLLNHVANSLPSKVVDFILSVADCSTSSSFTFQQKMILPLIQPLISAFLSCMLRLYRFMNACKKWDIASTIAVGSADLARTVINLSICASSDSTCLKLTDNNRRLCFDLVAIIISALGHSLSLNSLLSHSERKQFQSVLVDAISNEEKYVTTEGVGNFRLLLVQSAIALIETSMQYQPAFFADIASRIRPLVSSLISRFELYESLPSLYVASLKIVSSAWRFGRHQTFAKQLIEESGSKNFWDSVIHPLEMDVAKDGPLRKSQVNCLLTALEIISLEFFNFCSRGSSADLDSTLANKLTSVFDNGLISSRLESIFDFLLLHEEDNDFFPSTCSSTAFGVQTFLNILASASLPAQMIKPRQQMEIIDSCVSVCHDLLTDLQTIQDQAALWRTATLCRALLPPFLRALIVMVHRWTKTVFSLSSRSRSVPLKGVSAALNVSAQSLFAKCIDLCRMTLSANAIGDEIPIRFDEPGILSLVLAAECLKASELDPKLSEGCSDWFPGMAGDIITQMLATESDARISSEYFSSALSVLNALLLNNNSVTVVLLRNEIFICKLVECTAKSIQDNAISEVNIDALIFLLNVVHSLNAAAESGEQKQQNFAVKRVLSAFVNAFYSHAFFEVALNGSQPNAPAILRFATEVVIDIITALIMHTDGEKNFYVNIETACTFLAVYNARFIKLASHLSLISDAHHFAICAAWMRLIERITARLSLQDFATVHQSSSDLNLTEIISAFFMSAFTLLNGYHHSALNSSTGRCYYENDVLRICSSALNALVKVSPSLVHIIHGDLLRGGRQIFPLVDGDFSLVALGSSSPKQGHRFRTPQTLTFGFLFACFHASIRRTRRPSDGGHESAAKQSNIEHSVVAAIMHGLLQLIVTQAVLHLQLFRAMSVAPIQKKPQMMAQQQASAVAGQIAAFNDQLKPELGACFTRFRRFVSSLPAATLPQMEAEDFQALTNVYEQILCS